MKKDLSLFIFTDAVFFCLIVIDGWCFAYPYADWRLIKSAFSRALPKTEHRSNVRKAAGERGIWQRRYWEHFIRDDTDYRRHVDYVHVNPLKHGYVRRVADWPYSTFHQYVVRGIYPMDWCGDTGATVGGGV